VTERRLWEDLEACVECGHLHFARTSYTDGYWEICPIEGCQCRGQEDAPPGCPLWHYDPLTRSYTR